MTEEGREESSVEELALANEELNAADSLLQAAFARVSLLVRILQCSTLREPTSTRPVSSPERMRVCIICSTCIS